MKRNKILVYILLAGMTVFIVTGCTSKSSDDVVLDTAYKNRKVLTYNPLAHPFQRISSISDELMDEPMKEGEKWILDEEKLKEVLTLFEKVSELKPKAEIYLEDEEDVIGFDEFKKSAKFPKVLSEDDMYDGSTLDIGFSLTLEEKDAFFAEMEKLGYRNLSDKFRIDPIPEGYYTKEQADMLSDEEYDELDEDKIVYTKYVNCMRKGIAFVLGNDGSVEISCDYNLIYQKPEFGSFIKEVLIDGVSISDIYSGNGLSRICFECMGEEYSDVNGDDYDGDNTSAVKVYIRDKKIVQIEILSMQTKGIKMKKPMFKEYQYQTIINLLNRMTGDTAGAEKFVKKIGFAGEQKGKVGGCTWTKEFVDSNSYEVDACIIRIQ